MEAASTQNRPERLSYKFQRMRERIRQAVVSGELTGKLPGERELAKRYKANPKTLSKALTDLAAEGLLDRSIGRGTYVKGSAPTLAERTTQWLTFCDVNSPLLEELRRKRPELVVHPPTEELRPSFLTPFNVAIDLTGRLTDAFIKSLLVRGINVLLLGTEPQGVKVNAVLLDKAHAAWSLARGIFLAGHRRVIVVGGDAGVVESVKVAAARYAPDAHLETTTPDALAAMVANGETPAIICDGVDAARRVLADSAGNTALARASLAALGVLEGDAPCTGIYVDTAEIVETGLELVKGTANHRPTVIYLSGHYVQRDTVHTLTNNSNPTTMSA